MEYYQKTELERPLHIDGIYSFHYFEYVKEFKGIEEKHNFWELVYVDYGCVQVCSDNDTYILHDGEAFLHKPNERHNILSKNQYASVIIFSFDCEDTHLLLLNKKILKIYGSQKRIMEKLFRAGTQTFQEPWDIFDQQKVKLKEDSLYGMQQITVMYLEILLLKLIQNDMKTMILPGLEEEKKEVNTNVDRIVKILNQHLYDKISMGDICRESGCSTSYLAKIFKKTMNMGVMDYYNRLKIKEAKKLISEGEHTFTEIAEILNFSTVHYFSTFFKQITNMTPSGYKRTVKEKMTL